MDETSFEDQDFRVGWCQTCGRDVLTHIGAGGADAAPACVYCDAVIVGELRHVRGRDLHRDGYALWKESGCGRSGCGTGGCGNR